MRNQTPQCPVLLSVNTRGNSCYSGLQHRALEVETGKLGMYLERLATAEVNATTKPSQENAKERALTARTLMLLGVRGHKIIVFLPG